LVLELLLKRKLIELLTEGELCVYFFLGDAIVGYVEETFRADGFDEGFGECCVATFCAVEGKIDCWY
jgi:hypothetical protein